MAKSITYIVFDRHQLTGAIQATCSGDFERVIHLCPGWQAARALIRDYVNLAAGGLVICMFPAWHRARCYERKLTPAKKEPAPYPLPLGWLGE